MISTSTQQPCWRAGKQYNGTCTTASDSSPAMCLVESGSCKVEGQLAGGNVWDVCEAPKAAGKQCAADLVSACKGAALLDSYIGVSRVVTWLPTFCSAMHACLSGVPCLSLQPAGLVALQVLPVHDVPPARYPHAPGDKACERCCSS